MTPHRWLCFVILGVLGVLGVAACRPAPDEANGGSSGAEPMAASDSTPEPVATRDPIVATETRAPTEVGVVGETRRLTEAPSALDAFARAILAAHNRVRANVVPAANPPLPPLVWDESLAAIARNWADRCPDGHRPDSELGENLYWSTGELDVDAAIASWASEAANYDYRTMVCRRGGRTSWVYCGHYTQLVWRETTKLGCAARTNCPGDFANTVVCYYDPSGNVNVTSTRIPHPY